jgi:hypothetical protein
LSSFGNLALIYALPSWEEDRGRSGRRIEGGGVRRRSEKERGRRMGGAG